MKLTSKFSPFILILSLLFSCAEKENLIKIEGELYDIIEIDSITPRNINKIFYSEAIESIYFYNRYNQSIYFYDLASKEWLLIQIPQSYSKNENLNIGDTYFHNFDSIFIQDLTNRKVVILNSNGEIINTFTTYDPVKDDHIDGVVGNTQIVLNLPYIYQQVRPTQNAKYRKRYLMQQINLETRERSYLLEDHNQTNYSTKTYERYTYHSKSSKELFITQPFSSVILKYNYENRTTKAIDLNSFIKVKNTKPFNNDYTYNEHYLLSNQWFASIIFHEADTLLLRSIYQGMDIPKSATIKNLNYRSLNNDTIFFNTVVLKNDKILGTLRDFNLYNSSFIHKNFLYTLDFKYREGNENIIVFKKINLSELSNEK